VYVKVELSFIHTTIILSPLRGVILALILITPEVEPGREVKETYP